MSPSGMSKAVFCGVFFCQLHGVVLAQEFPARPMRIITSPAGGGSDAIARLIAQAITGPLGQPVIIDNRPSTIVGVVASQAAPDGYTLLVGGSSTWIVPLMRKMPFDPVKDFAPVTIAEMSPNVLVVPASLPVASTSDLIGLAKSKPGQLNYGSSAIGASSHFAAELFKLKAGISLAHVPYSGTAPALNAVLASEVQMLFGAAPAVAAHIKGGRLKSLGVTSLQPSPLAPGMPTVASAVPGFEWVPVTGVFMPAGSPKGAITRVNQEMVRYLKTADAKQKFLALGSDAVGSSPEELAVRVKTDMAVQGRLIRDLGLREN